tara:strand:- start:130 stop:420 length:291 start_codon:yes stop_codon:yes gene_type:complete
MSIADAIGIAGVVTVLAAYLLLQAEKLDARKLPYLLMNMIGSLGIIVSLSRNFNLASFLIESCWVAISVFGLVTYFRNRHRTSEAEKAAAQVISRD